MTLHTLSHIICHTAIKNKLFNYSMEGTTSDVNALTIKDYPLFLAQPQGPHRETETYTSFRYAFFYFDRAVDDNSNVSQIHSNGISALSNLLKVLREDENIIDVEREVQYEPFVDTEKRVLSDGCVGVFCYANILVPNNGECGIE